MRGSLTVGIASCSHHAVSGTSSQTLSCEVAVMFIPYLQQEGKCCSSFMTCCGFILFYFASFS